MRGHHVSSPNVLIAAVPIAARLPSNPLPRSSKYPPPASSTRPPENNEQGLRPLTPEEIPPNLNFYAMDPLYKAGTPLGWATERIRETLDRGVVAIAARRRTGPSELAPARFRSTRTSASTCIARRSAGETQADAQSRSSTTTDFVDARRPADPDRGWRVARGRQRARAAPRPRATSGPARRSPATRPSSCATTCGASIAWASAISTPTAPTTSSSSTRRAPSIPAGRCRARTATRSMATTARPARSCGASISGGTSTTASGSRRWSCAISTATARRRSA